MAQQHLGTDLKQSLSNGKQMVRRQPVQNYVQHDDFEKTQINNSTVENNSEIIDRLEIAENDNTITSNGLSDSSDNTLLLQELSLSSEAHPLRDSQLSSMYSAEWPIEDELINSAPANLATRNHSSSLANHTSFCYGSSNMFTDMHGSTSGIQPLGTKVEMVYSLLSMLDTHGKDDMSLKLLEMSKSRECCISMRQSGCLPLLVQLLHGNQRDSNSDDESNTSREIAREARRNASQALHNIVHAHPDDKRGRREARVLRMLEQIREYCSTMKDLGAPIQNDENANKVDQHPGPAIATLMKLSFDEEHRHAICQLGGLQAIAELITVDHDVHGNTSDSFCLTLRRYAGMALTNLTFGDGTNKALLCSMKPFMKAIVSQLHSPNEDLRQVTASVLRNLSWRADSESKKALRSVGVVTTLTKAAMEATKESTLKSILSALWNLSAHCSNNKADICAVDGALAFLVSTLIYKSPSKTLSVIENGGGILRNISSHIALCEEYRTILRKHKCLQTLLEHLKSPSLTIVSNACGTLWNLSARCVQDQCILWELGAVNMLRRLIHSRHKMIAMGSSAALKNLVTAKLPGGTTYSFSSMYESGHFGANMPSLLVRKQRALEAEIDHNLSETYDNIDSPKNSPTHNANLENRFVFHNIQQPRYAASLPGRIYDNGFLRSEVSRSDSHDSLGSTHSEPLYPHLQSGAFGLISRNAKFVSPDHRHYSVKIAEWKDFQLSSFKDNYIPFAKYSMLPSHSQPSISHSNDRSSIHSETLEKESEGMISINEFRFIKKDNIDKSVNNDSKTEILKRNIMDDETETSDDDSDKDKPDNPNSSFVGVSDFTKKSHLSKLATIAQKIDLFNIEDQDTHEQPIDYSLKYREESVTLAPEIDDKCPSPKMDNYVLNNSTCSVHSYQRPCLVHKNDNIWNNNQASCATDIDETSANHIRDKGNPRSYSESDFDNPDQPTDFSQKYTEHIDPMELYTSDQLHQKKESRLFDHHNADDDFDVAESKHHYVNDDTIKVYCTEDTPLNFSTASSLTDLRDIHITTPPDACVYKENEKMCIDIERKETMSPNNTDDENMTFVIKSTCSNVKLIESNEYEKKIENSTLSPKKITCNVEKEGKTVTFGNEVNYAEETPLMFSRSSSLASLSSFDQHSIHDDRSSVVSDFSRRASEVVSPSDLPDSPSQTVPPSPHKEKKDVFSFKTSAHSNNTTHSNASYKEKDSASVFDELKNFVEEGTPAEFSRATSLSSLIIDEDYKIPKDLEVKDKIETPENDKFQLNKELEEDKTEDKMLSPLDSVQTTSEKDSIPSSSNEPSPSDDIDDKSDLSEGESTENILAACISSGMPNNNSFVNGHNNSKLKSKVNNLGNMSRQLRGNNISTKSNNIRLNQSVLNVTKPIIYSNAATAGTSSAHRGSFGEDSLKVYKTEDTPSSLSHATSLSDLSNVSCTESNKDVEVLRTSHDTCSDSSSLCDENDNLLLQCIQSGMPQSKKKSREVDSGSAVVFKSKLPFPNRKSSEPSISKDNVLSSPVEFKPNNIFIHRNKINTSHKCQPANNYCVFNPRWQNNVEEKSSRTQQPKGHQRCHSVSVSVQSLSNHGTNSPFNSVSGPDSLRFYELEGTPVNFSRNDSLSSLTSEEDVDAVKDHKKAKHKFTQGDFCEQDKDKMSVKSSPVSWMSDITNKCSRAICLDPKIMPERFVQSYPSGQRVIIKNNLPCGKKNYSHVISSREQCQDIFNRQDAAHVSQSDCTLTGFSRNSSLSSLSVDSTDEPSSSEQALLEECISIGMPKDKSVKDKHGRNKSNQTNFHSKLPVRESSIQTYKNNKQKKTEDNINRGVSEKSIPFSLENEQSEEKGMEDERTKEKQRFVDFGSVNKNRAVNTEIANGEESYDVVAVLEDKDDDEYELDVTEKYEETDHNTQVASLKECNTEKEEDHSEISNCDADLSVSTVIKLEAQKIGAAIEEIAEDMTQSSISCTSDIENVNPPSVMDLNISLSSSGIAEWFPNKLDSSKQRTHGRRIFNNTRKQIPEPVKRALAGNFDIMKLSSGSDILCNVKPPSGMGSLENLSMKSSCTLIDNINPPTLMDDISMVASSASLNSISSDILENNSISINNSKNCTNDIYERLNAAAAMVEMYSREYNSITNGSVKSSHSTDMIEHIKPPSMTHNITEVTIEDATEIVSDILESDTEMGEDLPCDDDTGSETLKAFNISPLTKDEPYEGSTENLMSSLTETDTLELEKDCINSNSVEVKQSLENLNITAEQMKVLQENAQLVVTTLNEIQTSGSSDSDPDAINSNEMIEDETLSLVSNESDEEFSDKEKTEPVVEKPVPDISSNNSRVKSPIEQTKTTAVNTNTDTKLKVPKTKTKLPTFSTNTVRMTFQSQESENEVKNLNLALEKLQKQKNCISKNEMASSREQNKETAENQSCRPRSLIKQATFTKDKPEPNRFSGLSLTQSKTKDSNICKQNADRGYQTAKTESYTKKVPEKKSSKIGYFVRPSGSQNASTNRFKNVPRNNKNLVGNQTVFNKKDLTEFSRSQSPSSASIGARSGSLGSCSNSNVSLSSASSSGTIPDKSYGSDKKEVGSKVANIWKGKEKNTRDSPTFFANRKYVASPTVTRTTGNFNVRKSATPTKLQSPTPSTPSSLEGMSRSSTYEKLSVNEEKESSTEKASPNHIKGRIKSSNSWTRKEQSKYSNDTRKVNINGSTRKPNQGTVNKQFSPQGSQAKIPGAHHKIPSMSHQNHSMPKSGRNENKPVSAIVSPFNYNPSAAVQKPKNNVPSKSMIPAPKSGSARTSSINGIHVEENEGKRVRRTCLVTMV